MGRPDSGLISRALLPGSHERLVGLKRHSITRCQVLVAELNDKNHLSTAAATRPIDRAVFGINPSQGG